MSLNVIGMLGYSAVSKKLCIWLRGFSAKELALMFEVEERTARGWRDGNFPQSKHMILMVERWGLEFLEDIYAPVLETETTAEQHFERIEHNIRALRSKGFSMGILLCFVATFTTFADDGGDNPIVRVPRPTQSRTRRD